MSELLTPHRVEPTRADLDGLRDRLRALLEARNLSQNQAEKAADLGKGTLSKIFAGSLRLTRKHIHALAQVLEVPEEELTGDTPLRALLAEPLPGEDVASLQAAHARITLLEQELAAAQATVLEARREQELAAQLSARLRDQLREVDSARLGADEQLARSKKEGAELRRELGATQTQVSTLEARLTALEQSSANAVNAQAQTRQELEKTQAELEKAQAELRRAREEAAKWRDQANADGRQLKVQERELRALREEAAGAREEAARSQAIAETARRQASEWAKQAADQTSRADQLERLVKEIQDRAREETAKLSTRLNVAQKEAADNVSPGAAFLAGLVGLGLGAALGSSTTKPKRRY